MAPWFVGCEVDRRSSFSLAASPPVSEAIRHDGAPEVLGWNLQRSHDVVEGVPGQWSKLVSHTSHVILMMQFQCYIYLFLVVFCIYIFVNSISKIIFVKLFLIMIVINNIMDNLALLFMQCDTLLLLPIFRSLIPDRSYVSLLVVLLVMMCVSTQCLLAVKMFVTQMWQKAKTEGWERSFCEKNFIAAATMEMIFGMR